MGTLCIEQASEQDLSGLSKIERACFSVPWSEQTLQEMVNDPKIITLAAKESGRLLGMLMIILIPDQPPVAEILRVAVLPEARRNGVAQALLTFGEKALKEKEVSRILLEVRAGNAPAIGLYAKNGFAQIAARKDYYVCPKEDALICEKKLSEENR